LDLVLDAIAILERHDFIDSTKMEFSEECLKAILGCLVSMEFQGRKEHVQSAMEHVVAYSKTDQQISQDAKSRTPYLLAFGSPGSGKSRFLYL
jgi:hypothetical protein